MQKWRILVEVIFDPYNCLENTNKHSEKTLHVPMPHQRPKEHQNRAFRSNFSHLEMTMNAWKINFLAFFSFFPNSLYPMDPVTSLNNLAHKNTSLQAQGVSFLANMIRFKVCKWPKWKWQKNSFLCQFYGWIWPFPDLKPDPIGHKWYFLYP